MTSLRLHHVPQSRSQRVLWLIREMGLDVEVVTWPFDKTLRSPEFLALNPSGRVPALEREGQAYWESGALLELLCEWYPEAGLGRTSDHPERAAWLTWVHFAETISQHAAACTQSHIALREPWMRSPTVMKLEAARIGKCFDAVEAALDGEWLLSRFSAADVAVGQAALMAAHFHRVGARVRMAAWLNRLTARPAYQASDQGPGLYAKSFYEVPDG